MTASELWYGIPEMAITRNACQVWHARKFSWHAIKFEITVKVNNKIKFKMDFISECQYF